MGLAIGCAVAVIFLIGAFIAMRGRGGGGGGGGGGERAQRRLAARKVDEAEAALRAGKHDLALALLEKAAQMDPASIRARHGLAAVLFDQQRYGDAEPHLEWIHAQGRGSEDTHRLAALAALRRGERQLAIERARHGLNDDQSSRLLFDILGEAARQLDEADAGAAPSTQRRARVAVRAALAGPVLQEFTKVEEKLEKTEDVPLVETFAADPAVVESLTAASAAVRAFAAENQPVRVQVSCSTGEEFEVDEFEDADPMIGATLETLRNDRIEFVPLRELREVRFGEVTPWRSAQIIWRDGREESVHVPLRYRYTLASDHAALRFGLGTTWRSLDEHTALPVGVRQFRAGDEHIGFDTLLRIEVLA